MDKIFFCAIFLVGCGTADYPQFENPLDPVADNYIGDIGMAQFYSAAEGLRVVAEENGLETHLFQNDYSVVTSFEGMPKEVIDSILELISITDRYGLHIELFFSPIEEKRR